MPAVSRMNMPGRRVDHGKIRNLDLVRVQDFNQVRPCVFQLFTLEFLPPACTLPIDRSIPT